MHSACSGAVFTARGAERLLGRECTKASWIPRAYGDARSQTLHQPKRLVMQDALLGGWSVTVHVLHDWVSCVLARLEQNPVAQIRHLAPVEALSCVSVLLCTCPAQTD